MESTTNIKYQRIKNYLIEMSKDMDIKEEFIDRFAYNYANRGQWVSSEWIYEWFCLLDKKYKYYDFCSKFILKLNQQYFKQLDTQNLSRKIQHGGNNKQLYEISQKGIKLIMMQADDKTREYYVELEELMFEYIDKKEEELNQTIQQKEQENKQLKSYIEENKEEHVIYEHSVVGENRRYRGITNSITIRTNSHRRNSCNPHLRQAFKEGKQIETTIIKRFRSLSRNECKQIERDSILEIPQNERMNIRIPKVIMPTQQYIDNDLTTIGENIDQLTYQELNDIRWEETYQKCADYKQQYGKLPTESGQSEEIRKLSRWIVCMKYTLTQQQKTRYKLTDKRRYKIEQLIQDQISPEEQWNQNYNNCLEFKQKNGYYPKKGASNKKEQILGVWLLDCKRFLSLGKYNQERTNKMNILLEGYQTKTIKWETQYEQCMQIQQQYNRFPNVSEKRLYQWLSDQKTFLKNNDPRLTDDRKNKLNILLNSIQLKTLQEKWDEYYTECIQMMSTKQPLTSQQKNWLSVQKKAIQGMGYINEQRKSKIPSLLEQWQIYKAK